MLNTRQIIALSEIQDCGATTIRQIVSRAGLFRQDDLSDLEFLDFINGCISDGIKHSRIKQLSRTDFLDVISRVDRLIEESERYGIKAVSYVDADFPPQLLNTINEKGKTDIPILLFYKGDLSVAEQKGIAIVGTREPTREGVYAGEYFGQKLAEVGFNIVSGLALGCDTAVHRGALKYSEGKTTAFLAHGLDTVFPPENKNLATEITERGGLLMSEYPIGKTVNRYRLIARDRLQAAMSEATIVIQTSVQGGTYHAANATLLSGKPLFCVKYSQEDIMNQTNVLGNAELVSKGAQYLTSADFMDKISAYLNMKSINLQPANANSFNSEPIQMTLFE